MEQENLHIVKPGMYTLVNLKTGTGMDGASTRLIIITDIPGTGQWVKGMDTLKRLMRRQIGDLV